MTGPSSDDLEQVLQEALSRPLPWWRRLWAAVRSAPSTLARMGGYWGGVIMHGLDRATAFLRR